MRHTFNSLKFVLNFDLFDFVIYKRLKHNIEKKPDLYKSNANSNIN